MGMEHSQGRTGLCGMKIENKSGTKCGLVDCLCK